jgi:hypothetical protein
VNPSSHWPAICRPSASRARDGRSGHFYRTCFRKIYGPRSGEKTPGSTIEDIVKKLQASGFGQESYLIEWSNNLCDFNLLRRCLKDTGKDHLTPPASHVLRLPDVWKDTLKHLPFKLKYSLADFFRILVPEDKVLPNRAHRAGPDVQMTMKLAHMWFLSTRQKIPPNSIEHYLVSGTSSRGQARPISTAPDSAVGTSLKEGARKSLAREILTTADELSTAAIKTDQLCEEDELSYDQYIEVSESYEYSTQRSDADSLLNDDEEEDMYSDCITDSDTDDHDDMEMEIEEA